MNTSLRLLVISCAFAGAVLLEGALAAIGPWHPLLPAIGARAADCAAVGVGVGVERCLAPGDVFRDCQTCPEMVVVPPGRFSMGSPRTEVGRASDEGPEHIVTIGAAFAVGRFAVTFDEWDACVADGGCGGYRALDQGWGRGRRPVINVTLRDAILYTGWLSQKTGMKYRLPSEAEREYFTRAGTTGPFWWGTGATVSDANYNGNFTYGGERGAYRQQTLPVDAFAPNPWGLYQVHGNVWEWTADCYHDDYTGAPTDGSPWFGGDCSLEMQRGGSWQYEPGWMRSAFRTGGDPNLKLSGNGFRVVRALTP